MSLQYLNPLGDQQQATRRLEFQAVILAGGDDHVSQVYPLLDSTTGSCMAFLPLVNRPLLYYQLALLQKSGFDTAIVAIEKQHRKLVEDLLVQFTFTIKVDLFHPNLPEWDSGYVLKQLAHLITTDFLVVSGDLINEVNIDDLADVHRVRDASCTILLKEIEPANTVVDKKVPFNLTNCHSQDQVPVYFGLEHSGPHLSDHRVVYVKSSSEREDGSCLVGRNLLVKCPKLVLHSNLIDSHLYLFKRWVLDLIVEGNYPSLSEDLLPALVSLIQSDQLREKFASKYPAIYHKALSAQSVAHSLSISSLNQLIPNTDSRRIQVFAYVCPYKNSMFCERLTSFQSYGAINMALLEHSPSMESTPWDPFVSCVPLAVGDQESITTKRNLVIKSILGKNCQLHPTTSLSSCIVGDNCQIGANCKLTKCILLPGCVIEDGCQLQYCVLSNHVTIRKKSTLSRCSFGPKYVMDAESDHQNPKQFVEFVRDQE
ncbi:hypothetical protein BASA81_001882 [Batrachochytrium salamandrivorans]|nr:hypothetical protein BASA81_001882 [Batrachochytrium salamandrivorans]